MKDKRQHSLANLRESMIKRHQQAVTTLVSRHEQSFKQVKKAKASIFNMKTSAARVLSAGALSSAMLLSPADTSLFLPAPETEENTIHQNESSSEVLAATEEATKAFGPAVSQSVLSHMLMEQLPAEPRNLSAAEEAEIHRVLSSSLGVDAVAELDGYRLNTSFGFMGYEQHLPRFPGDTISQHDEYQATGITGSTGAWGYFTSSKETLTQEQIDMEKYYFAVQTFISPSWQDNVYATKDWFKFRKMIVVNPKTGDAVVGVVGDAGPAVWTGKQFGGSPEVMHELQLGGGMRNGQVILFFVDDPNNEIPLGPISFNE